jgi:hypothetical protein
MVTTLRTNISSVQWVAIVIQVSVFHFQPDFGKLCGLITTQYRPEVETSYPYSTYIVLLSQVFVSSVAGVYNQSLLKSDLASLHAQNTMLYAFGVVINGMIHTTIRIVKPEEPSLFAGYTNLPSYLVILSNVFIGLAITAVYKCMLPIFPVDLMEIPDSDEPRQMPMPLSNVSPQQLQREYFSSCLLPFLGHR